MSLLAGSVVNLQFVSGDLRVASGNWEMLNDEW